MNGERFFFHLKTLYSRRLMSPPNRISLLSFQPDVKEPLFSLFVNGLLKVWSKINMIVYTDGSDETETNVVTLCVLALICKGE